MNTKEPEQLSDMELLEEAKKMKKSETIHALSIGFMAGIIIYSLAKNTWGLVSLIPLFFIYKMTRKSERNVALKQVLKERNLK